MNAEVITPVAKELHLTNARGLLRNAESLLRTCAGCFGHDEEADEELVGSVARVVSVAIRMVGDAIGELDDADRSADPLFNVIDVCICIEAAMRARGFSLCNNVTDCPPQGALRLAARCIALFRESLSDAAEPQEAQPA